jgi:hypothetical protein
MYFREVCFMLCASIFYEVSLLNCTDIRDKFGKDVAQSVRGLF